MRTNLKQKQTRTGAWARPGSLYRLAPVGDDGEGSTTEKAGLSPATGDDELPFRIEVWNQEKSAVDLVLAVALHASVGYAAFLEAAREFPDRYVTMRLEGKILMRFNGAVH